MAERGDDWRGGTDGRSETGCADAEHSAVSHNHLRGFVSILG